VSEWHEVTDADDISVSEDGENLEIYVCSNDNGNVYVEVPIAMLEWFLFLNPRRETIKDDAEKEKCHP
jgi:hypothetical protein